jgi:hypothetical protein
MVTSSPTASVISLVGLWTWKQREDLTTTLGAVEEDNISFWMWTWLSNMTDHRLEMVQMRNGVDCGTIGLMAVLAGMLEMTVTSRRFILGQDMRGHATVDRLQDLVRGWGGLDTSGNPRGPDIPRQAL